MASTNKTPNYDLDQFIGSDKPTWLGDYNGDMLKIDTQMKANADSASQASSSAGSAVEIATQANEIADTANKTANEAVTTANEAKTVVNQVTTKADDAVETADGAQAAAANAQSVANSASAKADNALDVANKAQTDATNALGKISEISTTIYSDAFDFLPTNITIGSKCGQCFYNDTFKKMEGEISYGYTAPTTNPSYPIVTIEGAQYSLIIKLPITSTSPDKVQKAFYGFVFLNEANDNGSLSKCGYCMLYQGYYYLGMIKSQDATDWKTTRGYRCTFTTLIEDPNANFTTWNSPSLK